TNDDYLEVFEENQAIQIRVHSTPAPHAKSILVEFSSGSGAMLAIIPGFIGTIVVKDERVLNVSYLPSKQNGEAYPAYEENAKEIDKRHAYVAAAARLGVFSLDPADASKIGDFLRLLKSIDPTLGLYAAYAYAQVGAMEGIASVHRFMAEA